MSRAILLLTLFLIAGCDEGRDAWSKVLKSCSDSDLNGKKILYFGPSNNVGPGSSWRIATDDGYRLRWTLEGMLNGDGAVTVNSFVQQGATFDCEGNSITKFKAGATAGLVSNLAPVSADINADFSKAKSVSVSARQLQWDIIKELDYETYIKNLPANSIYRSDLTSPGRLVMYRALKVKGFEAILEFDSKIGAELSAKYTGSIAGMDSMSISPKLNVAWEGTTKMRLTTTDEFYIAGEMAKYTPSGFASAGKLFTLQEKLINNYTVGKDD